MVSFSRRLVVPGAVLVLLAIVAVGVVSTTGSASPDKGKMTKAHVSTLTVSTNTREAGVVDLRPSGASQGDLRVVNAPLFNASGTKKIGRLDAFCVQTDTGVNATQCVNTYALGGGTISAQGVRYRSDLSSLPQVGPLAISGGTGRYVGVEGEVRIRTRGDEVYNTFRFVD